MKWGTLAMMVAAGVVSGLPSLAGAGSPGPDETAAAPCPPSPVIAGIEWAPFTVDAAEAARDMVLDASPGATRAFSKRPFLPPGDVTHARCSRAPAPMGRSGNWVISSEFLQEQSRDAISHPGCCGCGSWSNGKMSATWDHKSQRFTRGDIVIVGWSANLRSCWNHGARQRNSSAIVPSTLLDHRPAQSHARPC